MKLSLNNSIQQEKFFFATADAGYYDETIELTVPYYQLIHKTMVDIIKHHFGIFSGRKSEEIEGIILDVGAGTGTESISVLSSFPNLRALAVDISAPMERIFETNYEERIGLTAKKRYKYVINDILKISDKDDAITDYYKTERQGGCLAAISAYCIHHFNFDEKRRVYQKMFDFLVPGGIIINVDLFNYESEWFSRQAHESDIDYIDRQFDNPSPEFENSRKIPFEQRMILKEKWIQHMNNDNILHSLEAQKTMLEEIGFTDVECVLKYWQQGILCGRKPSEKLFS